MCFTCVLLFIKQLTKVTKPLLYSEDNVDREKKYICLIEKANGMGRIFLQHIGGMRLFSCAACDTFLTNRNELISTRFTGATGRAFLFNRVVNLNFSEVQDRVMLTGRHMVRDVSCKNCDAKLGWIYEFATEENQRYKEGRVILERALVTETDGFEEHMGES